MRSKKTIYNIATTLFLQLIIFLSGFIVRKLIIQSFGSDVNGLVTSITQFISYITLLESGIGPVIKAALYGPISKKNEKEIKNILYASEKFFKMIAKIFIVYLVFLFFLYPMVVSKEFNYLYTVSLILIISISTFAEYYFGMTYKLYLQADQKIFIVSFIQIGTYILSTLTIYILIRFNCNIHIVKLISGFIFVARPILQNIYVKKKYNINLKDADKKYKLKQKWEGLAQHIAAIVHANVDIAILTIFSNLVKVSIYSVYALITNGLRLISQSFNDSMEAVFGNMLANSEIYNLYKKFGMYETLYFTMITIIYSCSLILITPFVKVYTNEITDANYCHSVFGYLIVISELCWAIRQPYNNLIKAKGHFRETRVGAWLEAITNIVISIVLVIKFGLVGVAIGTLVAMLIRTVEFIYHANKHILNRKIFQNIKRILLITIEIGLIAFISKYLPMLPNVSYINWVTNALLVFFISCLITFILNYIFYKNDLKLIIKQIRSMFRKKIEVNK